MTLVIFLSFFRDLARRAALALAFWVEGPVGPDFFRVALNFSALIFFFWSDLRVFSPMRTALLGGLEGWGKNYYSWGTVVPSFLFSWSFFLMAVLKFPST
jgi:hypothetical protein